MLLTYPERLAIKNYLVLVSSPGRPDLSEVSFPEFTGFLAFAHFDPFLDKGSLFWIYLSTTLPFDQSVQSRL